MEALFACLSVRVNTSEEKFQLILQQQCLHTAPTFLSDVELRLLHQLK